MKKVLVVDDNTDILNSIQDLLELEGYEVITTPQGEEAARLAKENKPDIILLDLLLSGKDGSTICRELKENKDTKSIPVVMISAHPSAKQYALGTGANDFLAKPFQVKMLLDILTKHLN